MRRTPLGVLLSATLVLAACGEQTPTTSVAPPPPSVSTVPHGDAAITTASCPTARSLAADVVALFARNDRVAAAASLDAAMVVIGTTPVLHSPLAQKLVLGIISFVLKKYWAGALNGGFSATTQQEVVDLVNGLLCWIGLPQTFTLASLSSDGTAAVLTPSTPDTTVVTGSKIAGMKVDSGTVTQPVLVTIQRLPDSPGPLLTQLDQYPVYYQFTVSPDTGAFALPVTVGVCLASSATPPDTSRLRVAHNVAPDTMGSIQILPRVPAPFVDCTNADVIGLNSTNPLANLAFRGWRAARSALVALFGPERLMAAASGGVGGTTKNFSPFGLVDTLLVMTPRSDTSQEAPVGTTVASAPSLAVNTPQGNAYVGLPVTFQVTAGGGSLAGAPTKTDGSGVATVGSWTLGTSAGLNTVTAAATAPVAGTGVKGSPLAFHATALAPSQLAFQVQPSGVTAGATMIPSVQVAVEDQHGHVVTTASGTVTLALTGLPAGVTLTGGAAATLVDGVATFSGLSVNKVGTYTLTPSTSVGGVTTLPASASFTVSPGTPSQLVWTQQPSSIVAGATMSPAVVVTVLDAQGNTVTSFSGSVGLALSQTGVTLGGTTTVSAVNGVAMFGNLTVTTAGTGYTLVATGASLASAASAPFNVTNAAAAAIAVVAGNNQSVKAGQPVPIRPSVRVTDAYSNPVPGITVTFVPKKGCGTVTGGVQTTDATGKATVGSWTIAEGTNYLVATAGASGVAGNPVTFVATGTKSH